MPSNDFPLRKYAKEEKKAQTKEEKKILHCNRCGNEIIWKYSYAEYLKLKKDDPNFKNIPLNPDGTPHTCQQEQKEPKKEPEGIKLKCPYCNREITLSVK